MIDWSLFVPACLLLVFPADWLFSRNVELQSIESFHTLENSPRFRPWWWVPILWLDPVRGFAGAWLLKRSLGPELVDISRVQQPAYWLVVGVLAAAMIAQTLTGGKREGWLAPVGFSTGLALALIPPNVSVIALVAAGIGIFAFRRFHAFFAIGAVAIVALGFALKGPGDWLVPVAAIFTLPIGIALTTGLTLEIPTRDGSPDGRSESSKPSPQ